MSSAKWLPCCLCLNVLTKMIKDHSDLLGNNFKRHLFYRHSAKYHSLGYYLWNVNTGLGNGFTTYRPNINTTTYRWFNARKMYSIANALMLHLSCTNPSLWWPTKPIRLCVTRPRWVAASGSGVDMYFGTHNTIKSPVTPWITFNSLRPRDAYRHH